MVHVKLLVIVLCNCVFFALGIIDLEEPTTKPPKHRENLPWPSRPPPQYRASLASGVKSSPRQSVPPPPPPPAPPAVYSQRLEQSPAGRSPVEQRPEPTQDVRPSQNQFQPTAPKLPVLLVSSKQPLCPYKATGQFPYAADCRRFVNCFKGRGVLQVCAPGTLFNPLTQECDFPSKVTCLDNKADYRAQPQASASSHYVQQLSPPDSDDQSRQVRLNSQPDDTWKHGFKSYRVTPPPNPPPNVYNGHAGPYPPPGMPSPVMQPPPQPFPSPMLQPPNPPDQTFNTGSPTGINIPPMMYGGSPNTPRIGPIQTPNPGYYVLYQRPGQPYGFPPNQPNQPGYSPSAQNSPGYPPSFPNSPPGYSPSPQTPPQGYSPNSRNPPQGYSPNSQNPPQGYSPNSQNPPQGYSPNSQNPPQGYSPNSQNPPQGYSPNSQNPPQGYSPNSQNPPQGYSPNSRNSPPGYSPSPQSPSQGYSPNSQNSPQGYSPSSQNSSPGYSPSPQTPSQGYSPNSQNPSQGRSPNSQNQPQGYSPNSQNPPQGYSPNSQNPPQGYSSNSGNSPPGYSPSPQTPSQGYSPNSQNPPQGSTLNAQNIPPGNINSPRVFTGGEPGYPQFQFPTSIPYPQNNPGAQPNYYSPSNQHSGQQHPSPTFQPPESLNQGRQNPSYPSGNPGYPPVYPSYPGNPNPNTNQQSQSNPVGGNQPRNPQNQPSSNDKNQQPSPSNSQPPSRGYGNSPQQPHLVFPSPQSGYQPNPQNYPDQNPQGTNQNPQNNYGNPQNSNPRQPYPGQTAYNPQSNPNSFQHGVLPTYLPPSEKRPRPPGGPVYPQSREPQIFPQGGQPGYFLVNQTDPPTKVQPPKYNPAESSKHNAVKCLPGASGLFPHPDCFKFLQCDHGRTFVMNCGPGTAFNPELSVCDYPQNVDCGRTLSGSEPDPDEGQVIDAVGEEEDQQSSNTDNQDWKPAPTPPTQTTPENDPVDYDDGNPSELVEMLDLRSNFRDIPEQSSTTARTTTKATTKPTTKPTIKTPNREQRDKVYKTEQFPAQTQYNAQKIPLQTASPTKTPIIPKKNLSSRSEPPPISKQLTRLRGGQKANEGYLEMRGLKEWGMVCDKTGEWTITEAHIVCKQLGYERGAELTWQGRPTDGDIRKKPSVAFSSVWCNGNETNILDCTTKNDAKCVPERDAVWVKCHNNPQSQCSPGQASYKSKCYTLVVPSEAAKIDSIGFSQGEALAHCQTERGHLLDITSQEESDFVSEWLVSQNISSNIMTSGVGVSVMGASIWIWEGSPDSFKYTNWWPGWETNQTMFPSTKSNRALCVIARRYFPCPTTTEKQTAETTFCDAEYFFWDVEDCAIMSNKHPYVCERPGDDVGCVTDNGRDYSGKANVTETSSACLPWEDARVLAALKFRVSETTFRTTLAGHNHCRNLAGSDTRPWCYVASGATVKKESCDIPSCSVKELKIVTERRQDYKCSGYQFSCGIDECIPSTWVCDGQPDCKNGLDEANCTGGLAKFAHHATSKLAEHDKEKWLHTSVANCATRCLETRDFTCRSFSHHGKDQICLLSDSNIGLSGKLLANQSEWDFYESLSHKVDCKDKFQCDNGKCINKTAACNGKNDCGDRSDERNCSAANLGYEIRLGGSNNSHEGRVEIKILGEWGYVCDDQFDLRDAGVVCRELGFSLGAAEIRPHSAFLPLNTSKPLFLVDDLQCRGDEASLRECDFGGWGVHDCGNEEIVGVVCKVPGLMCAHNFWQCENSGECIPVDFLCDGIPDCEDGTDELPGRCKLPVEVRLVSKDAPSMAGRVEVRKFGVWGTVCDDDFGDTEAAVVCNALGYKGPAKSQKEAAYDPGEGIIWLDGVMCSGNETSIELCLHQPWGQTDCKHQEDVAVVCSLTPAESCSLLGGKKPAAVNLDVTNKLPESNFLPTDCGRVDEELKYSVPDFTPKVVKGQDVVRGTIPWQASLRVRTSVKSVHWCGAVVISPLHVLTAAHCLQDYTKSAYFVRVGDFDTQVPEGSEQEYDIEATYIHEDFDKGRHLSNDVALVKLKGTGIKFTSYVKVVCLPSAQTVYVPGTNCTISGWGSNGAVGAGYSRKLRAAAVPIISDVECRAPYVYGETLTTGMFCAGELQGGTDSCQGDSGGPFVCENNGRAVLYGVTSWGLGCGRANKPGVYTKIASYIGWINTKIHDSLNGR